MTAVVAQKSWWQPGNPADLVQDQAGLVALVQQPRDPVAIVRLPTGALACSRIGDAYTAPHARSESDLELTGLLPALYPEWLGDRSFAEVHGVRFPYVVGEMAQGIATARMVIEAVRTGCAGFFGSAGLPLDKTETALREITQSLGPNAVGWGANLIHSPGDGALEDAVVDLMLRHDVRRVSASAFMDLSPAIVRYAATGLARGQDGRIQRRNYVFAKISRPEIAEHFLRPAPQKMLQDLVSGGKLTVEEANLAGHLPVAEDLTCESDSGGHTDNRPLSALLPTVLAQRDTVVTEQGYDRPIRVGAAGGLGTPAAVAGAFQLGAAYVLTGSINQACVESGLSGEGRALLCNAGLADVAMAPAADMFELGVKVQVLKRGTLFAPRGQKLYDLYRRYDGLDDIPNEDRRKLEEQFFEAPLEKVWADTRAYFQATDPAQAERGDNDPKHRMALVFRWYLFKGSQWARSGEASRKTDYQIWCGPAMGAFNAWVRDSFLEPIENRTVSGIAKNLLEGAAVIARAHQLRIAGLPVPAAAFQFRPRPLG